MKKSFLFCLIAFILVSCNQQSEPTKEPTNAVKEVLKDSKKVTTPQRSPGEVQMDYLYKNTVDSINSFVNKYKDADGGISDVWWDSKSSNDQPFKRIRLCEGDDDALIIERRPFPFNSNLEVLGYSIEKEYGKDSSYKYFVESSRFKKNAEVIKDRKRQYISDPEEMVVATKIFYQRLREARENISVLNGKKENQKVIQLLSKNG